MYDRVKDEIEFTLANSTQGEAIVHAVVDRLIAQDVDLKTVSLDEVKAMISRACRQRRDRQPNYMIAP